MSPMLQLLGALVRNALTGYHEPERPTNEARTNVRRENIIEACQQLLKSIVGPGDLLDSHVRAEFAKEAYEGAGTCPCAFDETCLRDPTYFAKYIQNDVQHHYVSNSPFRDVAHAIVNHQSKIKNVEFFDSFIARIKELYPNHGKDEWTAMAIELGIIAACCAGVRDTCLAAGIEKLPLPPISPEAQPAHFKSVSDYSTEPLKYNKEVSWGPYLPIVKKDIKKQFGLDKMIWDFANESNHNPTSKGSPAPTTSMAWFCFMEIAYSPAEDIFNFFKVPGKDRHLTRGQLELTATEFAATIQCGS